jgi:hypothetical protein
MEEETVTTTEKDLLWFKLQAMAVIGAVAFGGGMVPLKKQSAALLSYGNAFSGGVFLAAGFLHMLGESVEGNYDLFFEINILNCFLTTLLEIIAFYSILYDLTLSNFKYLFFNLSQALNQLKTKEIFHTRTFFV